MGLTHDGGGAARRKCFTAAKPCDYCNSAAALLFCRLDFAFMCISCDAKLHGAAHDALKHERVWMCDVCEQAPAAVTCKADAAALCATCDRDIHSANPLARRHERAAVVPFYDTAESMMMKSTDAMFAAHKNDAVLDRKVDAYIPDPWDTPEMKSIELLFSDSDHFLDFDNCQICSTPYSDSVVPAAVNPPVSAQLTHQHSPENRLEIDFTRSNITSYNNSYTPPSISHSISSSSLDAGVVPDGSAASETSHPFSKITSLSIDLTANQGSQVIGMDREARVLRYREKRKNRKFEKTIRYASRKAYAEARPRIKGRFAKRTDSEPDINGIFSFVDGDPLADTRYGVVPTF